MSTGLVCVVSGGSRGLGAAVVDGLLADGHRVSCFSTRRSEAVDAWQNGEHGADFHWQAVDAARADQVQDFVSATAQRFGRLDLVINNAGLAKDGVLAFAETAEIETQVHVNLLGSIWLARAASSLMLRQRSGNIINISSVVGIRGQRGLAVYSSTKAAVDGLTRSLARELGPRGIRVNAIAPGYLDSEMTSSMNAQRLESIVQQTPLGRLGTFADVVAVIRFLISDSARFITGQTIIVDGGFTC